MTAEAGNGAREQCPCGHSMRYCIAKKHPPDLVHGIRARSTCAQRALDYPHEAAAPQCTRRQALSRRNALVRPEKIVVDLTRPNQIFELFEPGESPVFKHLSGHLYSFE